MTISRRLTLSYLAVLLLLGCNLGVYSWSDRQRKAIFEDLRRAISRQHLINAVEAELNDDQKQITLLSQIMADRMPGVALRPKRSRSSVRGSTRWTPRCGNCGPRRAAPGQAYPA